MKKQEMKTNLFGIIAMAAMFIVGSCASTSSDTKGKSEDAASHNIQQDNQPSAVTPIANEKSETVAVKIPEAEWLNKDEPREKIWEYTPPPANSNRNASPIIRHTEYRIREVEINASSLFLYVDHKLTKPNAELLKNQGKTESPSVKMFVDGCPAESPRFAGLMEYNGKASNLIVIPRMDLPDGDIELRVSAFGDVSHIDLLNYKDGLKVRTSKKQSRWYRGEGVAMEYPKRPGCPLDTIEEDGNERRDK